MDREILFRGKCVETGKWLYGGYTVIEPPPVCFKEDAEKQAPAKTCIVIERGFADWGMPRQYGMAEVILSTVGQYTGLTDKNGVKIFEGDIIRWVDWKGAVRESPVRYDPEWNRFCVWLNGAESMGVNQHLSEDIEVIGSVHDSPELIGGEDDG